MQASAILHALFGSMKTSQCKANARGALTCRNHGRASPKVGRGGGTGERPITSLQGQKRLRGWRAAADWTGLAVRSLDCSVVRGAASALRLGPWKNPSLAVLEAPLLPHATFGTFFGWWNPSPVAYPGKGHTPVGTAHQAHTSIQLHTRFSPLVPSSLPLSLRPHPRSRVRHSPLRS